MTRPRVAHVVILFFVLCNAVAEGRGLTRRSMTPGCSPSVKYFHGGKNIVRKQRELPAPKRRRVEQWTVPAGGEREL